MKLATMGLVMGAMMMGACAHPLEREVDVRHQARIEAANANKPLAGGAADGLGTYIARDHEADRQARANP